VDRTVAALTVESRKIDLHHGVTEKTHSTLMIADTV